MIDKFGNEIEVNDIVAIGSISGIELAYVTGKYKRNDEFHPVVVFLNEDLSRIKDVITLTENDYVIYNYKECMLKLPNCIRK